MNIIVSIVLMVLLVCGLVTEFTHTFLPINRGISQTTNCGVGAKLIDLTRGGNSDCDKREAGRIMFLMGKDSQAHRQMCMLKSSMGTFVTYDNCLHSDTVSDEKIAEDRDRKKSQCTKKSKTLVGKVWVKGGNLIFRTHDKCMEAYVERYI